MGRPLTIVLEAGLNADAPRGIDYYIANVISALAEVDRANRYVVFSYFFRDYERKKARLPSPDQPNFRSLIRRFPESLVRFAEGRLRVPLVQKALLADVKPDIYHVVGGGRLPHVRGAKTIVTFFDLHEEAFPKDGAPRPGERISDPYTYDVASRADCLVATGDYTKNDLMRYYGIRPEKIAVIGTGVNDRVFRPVTDPETLSRARKKYGLPERYFMVIGPYVPPKRTNADTILEAFAQAQASDCHLVLAGSRGPELEKLLEQARRLGLEGRVHAPGYLALEDLPAAYSLALAVVHPTSVEGFGFGAEVLACGTPFITSDLPGVVEAVADAALTVPPRQVGPLREAMSRVAGSAELREDLRRRGLERAKGFSYRNVASKIVDLYGRLAA